MANLQETPEFALIRRYFSSLSCSRDDVILGVGDDAALLQVPSGMMLAVSVDTLVSGVHFLADVSPESLGHKALAVNLSDLAAMGAEPAWVTLALTLPEVNESWIAAFSRGFAELARQHGVQLIGGDTTRGPLSITVQVQGLLPLNSVLRRDGALPGDDIYVTGTLGDAALALDWLKGVQPGVSDPQPLVQRLEWPQPRVEAGCALRDLAHSAIDLSDGLLADLGHVLTKSCVGACLELGRIPLTPQVASKVREQGKWFYVLSGGDDYELCVTLPQSCREDVAEIARELDLPITRIGQIEEQLGLRCIDKDGRPWLPSDLGYDHFSTDE
jgi:thiamine-monophosphate kinase